MAQTQTGDLISIKTKSGELQVARPEKDAHSAGLELSVVRKKVPADLATYVEEEWGATYGSIEVETSGFRIPGTRTGKDLTDLSKASYDAAWKRLGVTAKTDTVDKDCLVPAQCDETWLTWLYGKVTIPDKNAVASKTVMETHLTVVRYLALRAFIVKGVKVESLTTEKEAEKLQAGFGDNSVAPTGFYTDSLAFAQGALKLKRAELVQSGASTLTVLSRVASVLQSDVLIVMTAIEGHKWGDLTRNAEKHEVVLETLGKSLGLAPGAALFEKVATIAGACDKKVIAKTALYRDFQGSYDPPLPARTPFGEPGSRLTKHGNGVKTRHIHICRSMNAVAALIRNTKLTEKLAEIYYSVARNHVNDDPVLFEALAANAATRTDCHPKLQALLLEQVPAFANAAVIKAPTAPRPMRLAARRSP